MDTVHIYYSTDMDAVNMKPKKPARRAYHHGDLPQTLLKAALNLLDRGGLDTVTVRAVAREAGVAHSAPANHFKDRAALLGALATGIFEELAVEVGEALGKVSGSPRARLHAMAEVIVGYALRHPHRYRLLWLGDNFSPSNPSAEAAGTILYDTVKEILGTGVCTSKASIDSEVIAAWSLIHGYVSLRLDGSLVDGRDEVSGQSRAAAIVDVLIDGLGHGRA